MEEAAEGGAGSPGHLSSGSPLLAFARDVYHPTPKRGRLGRFADAVYGDEDRLPFHPPEAIRRHWYAEWRRRLRQDFDNVIVATGRKGRGKSTFGVELGLQLDPKRFDLDHVVYRGADLVRSYSTFSRGEVVVYDEAVLSLMSTDFATVESRDLVKAVTLARDAHLTTILCLPRFGRLNKGFRDDLVDYWVRIDARGQGVVHTPHPKERYSEWRGYGYFHDPEWNPYTWPTLRGTEIWKGYLKKRIEERRRFHGLVAAKLEAGAATVDRHRDTAKAVGTLRCEPCGLTFRRRDHLVRHQGTKAHEERAGRPPPAAPA